MADMTLVTVSKTAEFDDWTGSLNPSLTLQYIEPADTEAQLAKNVFEFSKEYINVHGNGRYMDFEDFKRANPELEEEDAAAIFNMIDIKGAGRLDAGEYASYFAAVDKLGGSFDGCMNIEDYTLSAQAAVFSLEKYKGILPDSEILLSCIKTLMKHFYGEFFKELEE